MSNARGKRIRTLLADDHILLLEAIGKLLEPECEIVGAVADGRALVEAAKKLRPEVVILDITMPRLNGLDAGRQLKELMPEVKLVYLTVSEDPDTAAEALRVGASGYVLKNSAAKELFIAIHTALDGGTYVTPSATSGLAEALRHPKRTSREERLTTRQREVLQLLVEGHSMKETGAMLGITPRTVAYHKYAMMKVLDVETTADLIRLAVSRGLISG